MQVYANKFEQHIQRHGLPNFVLVFGDEPQQKLEVIDHVRNFARQSGFDEKQSLVADREFNWSQLIDAMQTMSLFADKQYIELTLPTGKPGSEGAKVLSALAAESESENMLLIQGPRIGKDVQNTKWFKNLNEQGLFIHTYDLEGQALHQWIQRRIENVGIGVTPNGVHMLADSTEGNLIAARQEIDKLTLMVDNTNKNISDEQLVAAIIDHSRYTVFQLTDELLKGEITKAIKILHRLESEGVEPNVILWALVKEAQTLQACKEESKLTGKISFNKHRIWSNKQALYREALNRLDESHLTRLLNDLQVADMRLKSEQLKKPFVLLSHILILFIHPSLPELA